MSRVREGENLPLIYRPQNLTLTPVEKMIIHHQGSAFFGVRDMINILMNNDGVYYLKWTDEVRALVAVSCCISEARVSEILKEMIRRDYFNKKVFYDHKILTNAHVQKDLVMADRQKVCIIQEFLSFTPTPKQAEKIVFLSLNGGEIPQRKEEKRKDDQLNHNTKLNYSTTNKEKEKAHFVPISLFQEMVNKFKREFPDKYMDDVKYIYDTVDMDLLISKIKSSKWLMGNNWSFKSYLKNYDKVIAGCYDDYKPRATASQGNPAAIKGHNYSKDQLDTLYDDLNQIEI